MMGHFYLLAIFASLAFSRILTPSQNTLIDPNVLEKREKVPGDNPAYYTRKKKKDQLFYISEFAVSPYPPEIDHRVFFYLRGSVWVQETKYLNDATLELIISSPQDPPDVPPYRHKNKISEFGLFRVHDDDTLRCGGPLLQGFNEIDGNFFMLNWPPGHGKSVWDMEAVARLPDEKVLFAFGARVEYDF